MIFKIHETHGTLPLKSKCLLALILKFGLSISVKNLEFEIVFHSQYWLSV